MSKSIGTFKTLDEAAYAVAERCGSLDLTQETHPKRKRSPDAVHALHANANPQRSAAAVSAVRMDNVMPAGVELPQLSPSGGYAAAAAEFDQTYGLDAAATVRGPRPDTSPRVPQSPALLMQPSWQGDSPVSAHCLRTMYTQPVPYSYNAGTGQFVTSSQHPSAYIKPISAMGHYGAGPV